MTDQPDWTVPTQRSVAVPGVIVGAGIGTHYRKLFRSTINHCEVHCPDAWKLWYESLPANCPPHEESQYAFKIYALLRAVEGFQYILWMDATFQPTASIEPLWERIRADGWYVAAQGAELGNWVSDAALNLFGISRDAAMEIPLVYSGLVGLDLRHSLGNEIWRRWKEWHDAGAFNGPHRNLPGAPMAVWGEKWTGHCSLDPRCEGHRHDEAALSFVLHSMGLKPLTANFAALGISRFVPDYDVPAMRKWILENGGPKELCR